MTKLLAALALAVSATSAKAVQTCHLEPVPASGRNQTPATLVLAGDTALVSDEYKTQSFECQLERLCDEIHDLRPGKLDLTFEGYALTLGYFGGSTFGIGLYKISSCQGQP